MPVTTPSRPRCLVDCVASTADSFQSPQQKQEHQSLLSSSSTNSAATKSGARLALTGRYRPCKTLSHADVKRVEHAENAQSPTFATTAAVRQGPLNFKLTPPDTAQLKAAYMLLEDIVLSRGLTAATSPTLASALMKTLGSVPSRLSGRQANLPGAWMMAPDSDTRKGMLMLSILRSLCECLTQPPFSSWQAQQRCRSERASNMAKAALLIKDRPDTTLDMWDAAVRDSSTLVESNILQTMLFGQTEKKCSSEETACTQTLLEIRMMLRCEPFIVICEGAAHMGAFMQLAKLCELHLQLLPSKAHVSHLHK